MAKPLDVKRRRGTIIYLPNSPIGKLRMLRDEIECALSLKVKMAGACASFVKLEIGKRGLQIDEFAAIEFRPDISDRFVFKLDTTENGRFFPLITDDANMMAQFVLLYIRERLAFLNAEAAGTEEAPTTPSG